MGDSQTQITYIRHGNLVSTFTAAEDAAITELWKAGKSTREIARAVNAKFKSGRSAHTVCARLGMIGAKIVKRVRSR
jgi:hypothetical protein